MNKLLRRLAAVTVASVLAVGGITLASAPAYADQVAGTIHLYHSGGVSPANEITSGSTTTSPMFSGISINGACPAGFRDGANTAVFQGGVFKGALAQTSDVSVDPLYGSTGLKGTNVSMDETFNGGATNTYVNNKALNAISGLVNGAFELRYYCFASASAPDFATDKYYSLSLTLSGTTWSVPVAAIATTVSLTAATQGNNAVLLTGTVKDPTPATATAAVGTIQFFDGTNTLIGTGVVVAGVGTYTTPVLPAGVYSFTAKFLTGNGTYADSPFSGSASASVNGNTLSNATITVVIPSGIGTLSLTGVPSSVNLGTAALVGGVLAASAPLGPVTVTDTRQLGSPSWSLTGQVSDFSDGTHTLLGKYLGWAPSYVSGPGVAGATVAPAPGTANGLKTAATLATGSVVDGATTTVVNAQLNLAAPANTAPGTYSATLTITLI